MKKMDRMKIRVKRTTVMIVRHSASHSGPVEGQSDKRRHCDPLRCYRPGAGITLPPLLCSPSHSRNTGLETPSDSTGNMPATPAILFSV